jgi:signal transduction histidine kinase
MAGDHHRELIEGARQLLTTLALLREVQSLDGPVAQHTFSNIVALHPVYANIGGLRPDGSVFASAVPMTGEDEFYDRACFQEATNSLTFTIGEYQVSRLTKKATLSMAYPAVDASNQLRAVVYAALDLTWLNRLATNFHLPEGSSLTVLDRNRITLIRYPDPEGKLVGQQLFNTSVSNSFVLLRPPPSASARDRTFKLRGRDGVLRLYASRWIGRPRADDSISVAVGIPVAQAYASANAALVRHLLVLAGITAGVLILTWVSSHVFILRRVKALVRATEKIGAGDYTARTGQDYGRGELHLLTRAFDEMAESLERRVAERERAEAQLRGFNQQLEDRVARRTVDLKRSNEDLEQFAYVASHDLQEPLRMVSNYMALLRQRYADRLDARALEYISFAVDGAQRMQELIQDLLTYARVDTKGRAFTPTDVNRVLNRALLNLQVAIAEAQAQITHDPLPSLLADEVQLTQLFQNLISNAIKFRSERPPAIHVSAREENGGWHFVVRDNGIGVPVEHSERIFVIFQRLHGRGKYPGTGIGLSLCKKIVERHGGRIWVESQVGQGTEFHFTISGTGSRSETQPLPAGNKRIPLHAGRRP